MKFHKSKYLFFVLFAWLINSCASKMYFTTLDILKPAEVSFPLNVNNVVVVNNATPQPDNIGHYTTTINGNLIKETVKFDSAAIFVTAALRDGLTKKSFFNRVEMSSINQNDSKVFNIISKLSPAKQKALFNMYDANAIIALNKVTITDNISEYYDSDNQFYNELDVKVKTDWSIHYPDKKATVVQFVDSFLWESNDYQRMTARDKLPKRADALVDASILSGSNTAERMIPRWEKEDRYFFNPNNKIMRQAMDSVPARKWGKAIELWKKAAENANNKKLKYQAYHNTAIAYEILGDMEKAVGYSQKAVDEISSMTYSSEEDGVTVISYFQTILNRKREMELLKKQLGE